MLSGTLISFAREETTPGSGGSARIHRCSLTVSPHKELRIDWPCVRASRRRRDARKHGCRSVSRILSAPLLQAEEAAISLGRGLLHCSCGLPESNVPPESGTRSEQLLLSYLALLRGGLSCPRDHSRGGELLPRRFTLTPSAGSCTSDPTYGAVCFLLHFPFPPVYTDRTPAVGGAPCSVEFGLSSSRPEAERGCPTCNSEL